VVVVVLVVVDVEVVVVDVVVVDVLVVLVVVVEVVEVVDVVGTATPQCASVQRGCSLSPGSSVTRHVSEGSAQCENGITLMSHSAAAAQRGALGSTHKHPANRASPWKKPSNDWHRRPSGHVPPQVGNSPPSQTVMFSEPGGGGGVSIAG